MYNDIVTVFNRKIDDTGDYWYPTVLHNVHVNVDRAAMLAKYGETSADSAALNVRYQLRDGAKIIEEKRWLLPKEWEKQGNPSEYITFKSGDTFDFFIVGEWASVNPINNDEYADLNGFYNYLNKTYDYVFAISSVGEYSVIPHFEILGR